MRTSSVVLLVLFGIVLLIALVWMAGQDNDFEVARAQLKLAWLARTIGLFLTTAAVLALLLRAVAGDPPGRMIGLVLAALAGSLLVEPSWAVALGLAAGTVALALRPWIIGQPRRMSVKTTETPPVL